MTRRSEPSTLHVWTSFACVFENSCLRVCLSHFNFTLTGDEAMKIVAVLSLIANVCSREAILEGHLGCGRLDRDARVDLLQLPHGGLFGALLGRQIGLVASAASALRGRGRGRGRRERRSGVRRPSPSASSPRCGKPAAQVAVEDPRPRQLAGQIRCLRSSSRGSAFAEATVDRSSLRGASRKQHGKHRGRQRRGSRHASRISSMPLAVHVRLKPAVVSPSGGRKQKVPCSFPPSGEKKSGWARTPTRFSFRPVSSAALAA